jgi:hypothetical protein
MKIVPPFFCLILVVLTAPLGAQSKFIQPGAQWHYVFNNFWIPPLFNVTLTYIGDTVIGGDTAQIINGSYVNKNANYCFPSSPTFIKQKGDTIFFRNSSTMGTWLILYNFATPVGQTWVTNFPSTNSFMSPVVIRVDSVKTVFINSIPLRQLKVRYFHSPFGVDTTYITERIGCHQFMFNFFSQDCATDQPWFKEFICYNDNSIGSVQIGEKPCSYRASVDELHEKKSVISFQPNPASQTLVIVSTRELPNSLSLIICDVTGNKIKTLDIPANTKKISFDISDLQKGLYLISGETTSQKLIISE